MATNDITGDKLISKTNTKAYEDRYDLIFRKQVEGNKVPSPPTSVINTTSPDIDQCTSVSEAN